MQAANPRFLFDFGSPNAYLVHQVLPAIEARTGVVFEQVPILLGGLFELTGNRSPAEIFANVPTAAPKTVQATPSAAPMAGS